MPAKNTVTSTQGKQFNPTITAFFDAPKFSKEGGEGDAFLSANIDAKAFETIQKHVQLGTKLLLRKSPRLNKNGGRTFYLEVLPPLADSDRGYSNNRKTNTKEDEI